MAEEHRYVLMLDKERDFIRVFRSDSPMRPLGEPLWEGDGLRRTYSAMVRLNKERRPAPCYYVCSASGKKNLAVYRVFKSSHPKLWIQASMHTSFALAVAAARVLRNLQAQATKEQREAKRTERAARKAEDELILTRLRNAGVVRKKVPKLTAKDIRYLEWLENRKRLIKEAA